MKTEAVFLDRDGTINEEVGYLDSLERLVIYPRAPEAIKILNESRMKVVVVTNQSGVARGYFTEDFVTSVHERMQEVLAKRQAHLDALYYCPHHPEGLGAYRRKCPCRKPEPGMLFAAAREMDLDLSHSYLIGDTRKDMETALAAGVKGILVRTGYGVEEEAAAAAADNSFPVAEDILAAVNWIIGDRAP